LDLQKSGKLEDAHALRTRITIIAVSILFNASTINIDNDFFN